MIDLVRDGNKTAVLDPAFVPDPDDPKARPKIILIEKGSQEDGEINLMENSDGNESERPEG